MSEENWGNERWILEKVSQDGQKLEYASYNLRNNEKVVLAAMDQSEYAIEFASDDLKDNEHFLLKCLMALLYQSRTLGFCTRAFRSFVSSPASLARFKRL